MWKCRQKCWPWRFTKVVLSQRSGSLRLTTPNIEPWGDHGRLRSRLNGENSIKIINLKTGMPTVSEALQHLDRELARARQAGSIAVKLIHGYGSSGAGGEIRIAVQRRLTEMTGQGEIRACIFGENWAKSDEQAWALIRAHPELKKDADLGKRNLGITIVVL